MMSDNEVFRRIIHEGTPQPFVNAAEMLFGAEASGDPLELAEEHAPIPLLEKLAASRNCDADLLAKLTYHDNARVRRAVASSANLTESLMWQLASDVDYRVRLQLAGNSDINVFVLETLAEDENRAVAARAERTLAKLSVLELGGVIHWLFPHELKKIG